jgi:hypothetical protein
MSRVRTGRASRVAVLSLAAMLGAAIGSVHAQTTAAPEPPAVEDGAFELGMGVIWIGGSDLGSTIASLTPNSGGTPFILFRARTNLAAGAGIQTRLGYRLSDSFTAEAAFSYRRPEFQSTITDDVELPGTQITLSERLAEYVFELNGVLSRPRWALAGGRTHPFLQGGAGYLNHYHEGGRVREGGWLFHVGGGMRFGLAARAIGWFDSVALRTDARVVVRSGGVGADDQTAAVVIGLSLVGGF